MHELDRRSMLKVVAALSLAPYSGLADEKESSVHLVERGTDRTGQPHKAARANSHLDFKVLSYETSGALFIMENRNMVRGGPPRHVHYEQEEWFFLVRTPTFEPTSGEWTETEAATIRGWRWWSIDELRATGCEVFPEDLADKLERLLPD
jgi:hypothetical protein